MIKMLHYIPFQMVVFLSVGIVLGAYFPIQLPLLFGLGFGLLLFLSIRLWRRTRASYIDNILGYCCFVVVGMLLMASHNILNNKHHYSHFISENQETKRDVCYVSIRKVLKPTLKTQRFYAEVTQINKSNTTGSILLSIQRDSLENNLKVDDEIIVKTSLDPLSKPLNPYVFDYSKYLNRKLIFHQLYLKNGSYVRLKSQSKSLDGFISDIHKKINKQLINNGMSSEDLGFINALLLGKRQFLSKDVIQTYSASGAIHILAISGLHIGVLLLLLRLIFQFMNRWKYGKLVSSICIVIILWGFAFLAGMSASVVRAVTMFTALQVGMSFNKRHFILNTIFMSMLFLLIANPNFLFDVGFQLSYAAVLSIVLLRPVLSDLWKPKNVAYNYFWDLVTVSLAAQIGVLPLSLYYFHQFPVLFLISNLCIIPMLAILLFTGVFTIIFSLIGIPTTWLISVFSVLIYYMNTIVNWVSAQELFLIQHIHFSGLQLSISLCVLVAFAFLIDQFRWRLFYAIIFLFFGFQFSLFYHKYSFEKSSELIVYHQYKKSKIVLRIGDESIVYASDSVLINKDFLLRSYQNLLGMDQMLVSNSIPPLISFSDKILLVVDSDGVYNVQKFSPNIILLRGSPKINLERLIALLKPAIIIADGSNYPSFKKQWKQTCIQQKTPFHDTSKKGAYVLKE